MENKQPYNPMCPKPFPVLFAELNGKVLGIYETFDDLPRPHCNCDDNEVMDKALNALAFVRNYTADKKLDGYKVYLWNLSQYHDWFYLGDIKEIPLTSEQLTDLSELKPEELKELVDELEQLLNIPREIGGRWLGMFSNMQAFLQQTTFPYLRKNDYGLVYDMSTSPPTPRWVMWDGEQTVQKSAPPWFKSATANTAGDGFKLEYWEMSGETTTVNVTLQGITQNKTAITQERSDRETADTTIVGQITAEQTSRMNADNAIQGNIATMAQSFSEALSGERTARISADDGLNTLIGQIQTTLANNEITSGTYTIPTHTITLTKKDGRIIPVVISVASETQDGVMPKELVVLLHELETRINNMSSGGSYRGRFTTATLPTQTPNSAFIGGVAGVGDFVTVSDYTDGTDTGVASLRCTAISGSVLTWTFDYWLGGGGIVTIPIATVADVGGVKSVLDEIQNRGKIFVESDGTMSLLGYDNIMSLFAEISNITNLTFTDTASGTTPAGQLNITYTSFNGQETISTNVNVVIPPQDGSRDVGLLRKSDKILYDGKASVNVVSEEETTYQTIDIYDTKENSPTPNSVYDVTYVNLMEQRLENLISDTNQNVSSLYVNSALGTDDEQHGKGTGSLAFKTVKYCMSFIDKYGIKKINLDCNSGSATAGIPLELREDGNGIFYNLSSINFSNTSAVYILPTGTDNLTLFKQCDNVRFTGTITETFPATPSNRRVLIDNSKVYITEHATIDVQLQLIYVATLFVRYDCTFDVANADYNIIVEASEMYCTASADDTGAVFIGANILPVYNNYGIVETATPMQDLTDKNSFVSNRDNAVGYYSNTLKTISHDSTLTGDGTPENPLHAQGGGGGGGLTVNTVTGYQFSDFLAFLNNPDNYPKIADIFLGDATTEYYIGLVNPNTNVYSTNFVFKLITHGNGAQRPHYKPTSVGYYPNSYGNYVGFELEVQVSGYLQSDVNAQFKGNVTLGFMLPPTAELLTDGLIMVFKKQLLEFFNSQSNTMSTHLLGNPTSTISGSNFPVTNLNLSINYYS
jgi:hypothetical protein